MSIDYFKVSATGAAETQFRPVGPCFPGATLFSNRLPVMASSTAIPRLDHAAVGNGRVLALVSPTTAVDWLCLPRMDSPAVFARLLDTDRGGTLRLLSESGPLRGNLTYEPNTNVARTEVDVPGGTVVVHDFCPRLHAGLGEVHAPPEFVRLMTPSAGEPSLIVDLDPRPEYASVTPQLVPDALGIRVDGGRRPIRVLTDLPVDRILARSPIRITRPVFLVVTAADDPPYRQVAQVREHLRLTLRGWRSWARSCALPTFAAEAVLRSALCLKLHVAENTGAVIAAATTSIPEEMGTARTWDYRYCWLRDAAFVIDALRRLSQLRESERFIGYLERILTTGPLQPVYGLGGEREIPEVSLDHLAGFGGNGHVRIGNAAAEQRQNDLMGELVLSLGAALVDPRLSVGDRNETFNLIAGLVEDAITAAPEPDTGIWEYRTQLRRHTFSRAMCWAAMHHGSWLARRFGRRDLADRWAAAADHERSVILEKGYSERHGCFTQTLDGEQADASNLLLPVLGLVSATDPRMVSTVAEYERRLVRNGLMLRYAHEDDLGLPRSSFSICSFWWAELLALQGRLSDAEAVFRRLMSHANPLGLFSEDLDPETGAALGNFPQAYTHVGLIHAATTIGQLREARDGRARGWE